MQQPEVLWLNGSVMIDQTDAGTIDASDGPVELDLNVQQISAAGGGIVDVFTDEVKNETMVTLNNVYIKTRMLQYLLGMTATYGTMEDGATASRNYSFDAQCGSSDRPYVELLLTAQKKGTSNTMVDPSDERYGLPYRYEFWALRAKLQGAFNMSLSNAEYTKVKLVFKLHGDPDDVTATWFQIRDEEQNS